MRTVLGCGIEDIRGVIGETTAVRCTHCSEACSDDAIRSGGEVFCCSACHAVYQLINEAKNIQAAEVDEFAPKPENRLDVDWLENPEIENQFIEFSNENWKRVTFYVPKMHCAACVYILERLPKIHNGVIRSEVNFGRKDLQIDYDSTTTLAAIVKSLYKMGYGPDLSRNGDSKQRGASHAKSLVMKLAVAGFAFGNVMLFSFPDYLAADDTGLEQFKPLFGYLSLILALPVFAYSGSDYLKGAWYSIKARFLTIDVPIAIGMLTLFFRSAFTAIQGQGPGYFDSFTGLVFFLLIGRWYASKTHDAMVFDRDFRSYFPFTVRAINESGAIEHKKIEHLKPGDRIEVLHNQVVPTDGVLLSQNALIDYSFVTGEADPVHVSSGHEVYAGGRQCGEKITIDVTRSVDQGYLTRLWNDYYTQDAARPMSSLVVDKAVRWFSAVVLAVASITLIYWLPESPTLALDAFTAVLIVACPCALALAAPFTLGHLTRVYSAMGFYIKNADVIRNLASVDMVLFDKTGTLTDPAQSRVVYEGDELTEREWECLAAAASNSTHPVSQIISKGKDSSAAVVTAFVETPGGGFTATVNGNFFRLGKHDFIFSESTVTKDTKGTWLEVNGRVRGRFLVRHGIRDGVSQCIKDLSGYPCCVLSGDDETDRETMSNLFGRGATLRFFQSPVDKFEFVKSLQSEGHHCLFAGDGLNDSGAMRVAAVGVSVVDDVYNFSPACDVIMDARSISKLPEFLSLAKYGSRIITCCIALSVAYNAVGLYFAIQAELTPLIAAALMPISSVSVVGFTALAVRFRNHFIKSTQSV